MRHLPLDGQVVGRGEVVVVSDEDGSLATYIGGGDSVFEWYHK